MEQKKPRISIKLPDDIEDNHDAHDELLDELVVPLEILPDENEDNQREDTEERETVRDSKIKFGETHEIIEDETLKEDFFEAGQQTEEYFGDIEGMNEITVDDEEQEDEVALSEDYFKRSVDARRLSVTAKKFAEGLLDSGSRPEAEEQEDEVDTGEKMIDQNVQQEEQEERDSSEEGVRVSKITVQELNEAIIRPGSIVTAEFKPDDSTRSVDLSHLIKTARVSQISKDIDEESRISGPRISIYYDVTTRMDSSDPDLMELFDLGKQDRVVLLDDYEQEVEEESVPSTVEEASEALDRDPYYLKYDELVEQIAEKRIRNNILQKKVIMYLKRRKVENFLKDAEPPLDQILKYNQKLDAYKEILDVNNTQRSTITNELNVLKKKKAEQSAYLDKLFKSMQTREEHIGYGLIHTKTGNPIPDKLVERLIRRQKTQMEQVSSMRLKFIKLKGMVQEKSDAIDKIDRLENNLRLADYEQLKSENRSHADKIEERDEELTRLRAKCQNTIQILAHMREKTSALDSDVCDLREELEDVTVIADQTRANLADLKQQRDKYRNLISQLKDESGLLTQPDLLRDMEASQKELARNEGELETCKADVEIKTNQIRVLRKNIEVRTEAINRKRPSKEKIKKSSLTLTTNTGTNKSDTRSERFMKKEQFPPMVYSRKPTLYMPIIKHTAFDDLVKIRPNPRVSSKKRR